MRPALAFILAALALVAAAPARAAEPSTCSKATALTVAERLSWGDPTLGENRIAQVLCGHFTGAKSNAMAASVALPSCGGSYEWAVFRYVNGTWKRVLRRRQGAQLKKSGTAIVERQGVLAANDAHCFPSKYRTRRWTWRGGRFTHTSWVVKPAS